MESASSWPALLAPIYHVLTCAVVLAVACEWEHYRRLIALHWMRATWLDRAIVFWIIVAKSLYLNLPFLAAMEVLAVFGQVRSSASLGVVGSVVIAAWLFIDLRVQKSTGNHLSTYVRFIVHPKALSYAGGGAGFVVRFVMLLAVCLSSATAIMLGSLRMAEWIVSWWPAQRISLAWGLAIGGYLATLCGVAAVQSRLSSSMILERLKAALPIDLPWLRARGERLRGQDSFLEKLNRELQSDFRAWHGDLAAAQPADERPLPIGPDKLPNVVLIVLESLRHDAISPETMPKLHARAQQGLRFDRHYAGANASQFGLFSLLYGRSPLCYHVTLDHKIQPQACVTLRLSGYRATYFSSVQPHWLRMEEFLNEQAFDQLQIETSTDWPTDDAALLRAMAQMAAQRPCDEPQFLAAFLTSTHYPYRYPATHARHEPSMPAEKITTATTRQREFVLNRYRNAAGYLDEQIEGLLSQVDLQRNLVIVTGDHGESIFEDGFIAHYSRLSEMQTRVPLAMFGGGLPARRITEVTTHADLLPTLFHALAGDPHQPVHGHGFDRFFSGEGDDSALLCSKKGNRPWDALLLWRGRRLRLEMSMQPPRIRALGFADERCDLDPTVTASVEDATPWRLALSRELRRTAA